MKIELTGVIMHDERQTFTGTAHVECASTGCHESTVVNIKGTPLDDVTDKVFELTEAIHGWHRGMFCRVCSPAAFKDDEADNQNKTQKENEP